VRDGYVGPCLLREMQLFLHLRGDDQDIGGYKKGDTYLGTAREEKVTHLPQYDTFWE
jgi:hypothetical protein